MKKKLFIALTSVLLVVTMLACLCACGSTWGSIKGAYEKEGYEETEMAEAYEATVKKLFGDDYDNAMTVHIMHKDLLDYAIIVEFKSTQQMEEMLKDKVTVEDAKSIYDELQKLDTVNGNCFFCGISGLNIFKSTK